MVLIEREGEGREKGGEGRDRVGEGREKGIDVRAGMLRGRPTEGGERGVG